MKLALVDQIANAMLYEGYMLYPYRPSSVKNRQRWTFGGVYPQAYSEGQSGSDAWNVQTECLVAIDQREALASSPLASSPLASSPPQIDIRVRFLHVLARNVGALDAPLADLAPDTEPPFRVVQSLEIGERLFQTWQEAVEREVHIADLALRELVDTPQRVTFGFPARRELEPLRDDAGLIVGVFVREQQPIAGAVELAAEQVSEQLWKISVRVLNLSALEARDKANRDVAVLRSFVSTHMILGVRGGEFVSLLDPPEALAAAVASCHNIGVWPVLVGESGERDTMLASPIILYDYPQIAPESPGDLFDGTEIDEILTLRIMTMTDQEKREMGAVDERTRALLDRTDTLAREQMLRLHGTMRSPRPLEDLR